jgi:hypothetical protein
MNHERGAKNFMRRHLTGRCALGLAAMTAAVAASTLGAGMANALPAQTGDACPSAFTQVSVDAFGEPYTFTTALDQFGNGNGYICVFPLPDAVRNAYCTAGRQVACELEALGLPFYSFLDDGPIPGH